MHLYENEERSVHTWNAVDVEIGGHLQHGYVIGLEETENTPARAIVDFGCSTQQAVPVPYGKIWDCSLYRSTKRCRGAAVEVLLHDGPDRPWTWCPAKMLISGFRDLDSAAMVEVITDGQRRRELLRRRQIRDLCSTAVRKGLLSADHFVMQTCRVPNGYWTLPSAESALLLREVERMFAVRLVTVLSQKMHFVRRRQNECLRDEDLAMMFEKGRQCFAFYDQLPRETHEAADGEPKQKKLVRAIETVLALPLEVLKEIFHSLDTIDRQRSRRTCQLFEALLASAELAQDLRISPNHSNASPQAHWDSNYAMYACIFKYITPATRTICIRDPKPRYLHSGTEHGSTEELSLIKKVVNEAGIRVHRFIVHQRNIMISHPAPWKFSVLSAEISRLVSCCDRMIWKDYTLTLLGTKAVPAMEFRIPAAVFIRGHVDEADIVDLFEKHLTCEKPLLTGPHLRLPHGTTDWIDSELKATRVMQILQEYQSCDPRPSAYILSRTPVDCRRCNRGGPEETEPILPAGLVALHVLDSCLKTVLTVNKPTTPAANPSPTI